jgi:hypothetical protein
MDGGAVVAMIIIDLMLDTVTQRAKVLLQMDGL